MPLQTEKCWLKFGVDEMARKKIEIKFKATDYLYKVGCSEDDDSYVARVVEFPSLGAHGDTLEKALAEIQKVVRIVLKDLAESGEEIPEPFGKSKFSGKLSVRMPEEIHRDLAIQSAQQGISLSHLITQKLVQSA